MQNLKDKIDVGHIQRNDAVLANAAILYYKEGLTQNEIAKRMGVSRATVVNYLRLARENNIVDIRINGASFSTSKLSKDLKRKFGLNDAYVADHTSGGADSGENHIANLNRHVARVGAAALFDILNPNDVMGVAWGETIHFLSEEISRGQIEGLTVCQMIGSMKTPLLSAAETCAIRIASRLGAECNTLHTPAVLSSAELASALRAEPTIKSQLEKFTEFTRTVFSVGNCDINTHVVRSSITSEEEFNWYKSRGAVGVLCGRFIDEYGQHIAGAMDERMIGISLDELRLLNCGVLVAGGPEKLLAIKAALAGGYVSHLVVDESTAKKLLS
ncbi:MAG: sugar-binding transcriptional regulator [Hyphomicrobiales bacterium]